MSTLTHNYQIKDYFVLVIHTQKEKKCAPSKYEILMSIINSSIYFIYAIPLSENYT